MAKKQKLISFTAKHLEMLEQMMTEDGQEHFSFVIGTLIAKEYKEREELKNRRKQGRPRKEETPSEEDIDPYANDLPKNIPHGDRMIGPQEDRDIEEARINFFSPRN